MLNRKELGITVAAAATLIALSACNNPENEIQAQTSTTQGSSPVSSRPSAAPHNDADAAFTESMIPHHKQAVAMSDVLLAKPAIDPRVITLAQQIKAAQSAEIEQMTGWLAEWGASTSSPSSPVSTMPMSDQDMAALQNAQGAEASRLFLSQMIQHHEGALMMAQQEIHDGQFPVAVTMARAIMSAQAQEIATMKELLDSL
jgi:uncharacterized protein (DUF305 family)